MVLVIVSRNIDLSVGSLVGIIAMTYALLMTDCMPDLLGIGPDFPFRWVIALAWAWALASAHRRAPGLHHRLRRRALVHRHPRRPAVDPRRRLVSLERRGRVRPRPDFQLLGGGAQGSIGGTADLGRRAWPAASPSSACSSTTAVSAAASASRCARCGPRSLLGVARLSSSVLGAGRGSPTPTTGRGPRDAVRAEHGIPSRPGGLKIPIGLPVPDLLLIGVTLVMTFIATRRRFGRYVYAYGGNPEAAELAGINTRWTILKTFVLMGVLCAIAAAIAAARLNGATLDVGQSYELYVIAAAVVGGTSFAGGIGTIPGAVLGAFVMQSLAYGLSFMRRQLARPERRRRHRPDPRRRLRHAGTGGAARERRWRH